MSVKAVLSALRLGKPATSRISKNILVGRWPATQWSRNGYLWWIRAPAPRLNTHQSESLVLWVAGLVGLSIDCLGVKGKSGILKTMSSRALFLQDPTHQVCFLYTPKHCSWLNQIEIWFGILSRKLLRRGNFTSQADLKTQVEAFMVYFNAVLAKPFKWTYDGKPCRA